MQRPAVLGHSFSILAMGSDHLHASLLQEVLVERIGVVGLVADQHFGLHVEKSAVESFVDEGDFSW
jgi:hypothetical protein